MLDVFCGVTYAQNIVGGRWKLLILYKLEGKTLRFSELKRTIPNITERMLTLQLKELENDGLIIRNVLPEVPVRVEYKLSPISIPLSPIWRGLESWGENHRKIYSNLTKEGVSTPADAS